MDTRRRLFQANNAYRRPQWWELPWITEAWTADIASTVTITGSDVDEWAPVKGTHSFTPPTSAPTYFNGVIAFDGVDQYLKTGAFTLNQPTVVFAAVNLITWVGSGNGIFDGNALNSMRMFQSNVASSAEPDVNFYAGDFLTVVAPSQPHLPPGLAVVAIASNGAASSMRVNLGTILTGNPGANNAGGFTLGSNGDGAGNSEVQFAGFGYSSTALTSGQIEQTIRAMARRYGITV